MAEKKPEFTHIKDEKAYMVDVTAKDDVAREATAEGKIYLRPATLQAIDAGTSVKGNVLGTARIAAIMAAKETSSVIPMCHPLPIGGVDIDFSRGEGYVSVKATVKTYGKTGIEMEALHAASVALLTIWDMVKSAEKDEHGQYPFTRIADICVTEKKKGLPSTQV